MNTLSLFVGTAALTLGFAAAALAETATDTSMMTCTEFMAMDADGMMMAGKAVGMAADTMMEGDAMADDAMADDAMADDAMADDAMATDTMADDMTARISDACKAHPDAKVVDALAM